MAPLKPHCSHQAWSPSGSSAKSATGGSARLDDDVPGRPEPCLRLDGRDRPEGSWDRLVDGRAEFRTAGVGGLWKSFDSEWTRLNSPPSRPRKLAAIGVAPRDVATLPGRGARCRFAVNFIPGATPGGTSVLKRAPRSSRKSRVWPTWAPRGQTSVMSPSAMTPSAVRQGDGAARRGPAAATFPRGGCLHLSGAGSGVAFMRLLTATLHRENLQPFGGCE